MTVGWGGDGMEFHYGGQSAGVTGNTVSNNTIENVRFGVLFNSGTNVATDDFSGNTVTGNTITDSWNGAILFQAGSGSELAPITISDNIISGTTGQQVDDEDNMTGLISVVSDYTVISGNTITGNVGVNTAPQAGIWIDGSHHTVTGNTVTNNVGDGIHVGWYKEPGQWSEIWGPLRGGVELTREDITISGNSISGNTTGVQVSAGDVTIADSTITGNTGAGVDVQGGNVLIENTDLTGNTIGVLIRNGGIVDLGDDTNGNNITGLGTGSGTNGSSIGGNDLTGYTSSSASTGAIVNLRSVSGGGPQGGSLDVPAFGNSYDSSLTTPLLIENAIYHDNENAILSFVDFGDLDGLTIDSVVPDPVDEGSTTAVTISFTNDPQEHTLTISWGDGSADTVTTLAQGDFEESVGHVYADNGTYTINVTVEDSQSQTKTASTSVGVGNVAPTLTVRNGNQTVAEGTELSLTDLGAITDPGFANAALSEDETFTYSINWGDGSSADTGSATIDDLGEVGDPTDASFDGSHTYADNGSYTVTVRAADDDMSGDFVSGTAGVDFVEQTFTVDVGNVAPTLAPPTATQSGDENNFIMEQMSFSDPAFDNSPDQTHTKWWKYDINWGDGNVVTGKSPAVVNGSEGTPTTGTINDSHVYDDDGSYTVQVTVYEDDGGSDMQSFQAVIANIVPTITTSGLVVHDEGPAPYSLTLGHLTEPGDDTLVGAIVFWGDGPSSFTQLTVAQIDDLLNGIDVTLAHQYDDDELFVAGQISVTLVDEDGVHVDAGVLSLDVRNVAPTGVALPGPAVSEGSAGSVFVVGSNDASSVDTFDVTVSEDTFRVIDLGTNASGFEAVLNRELDLADINLYDTKLDGDPNVLDAPDVTLIRNGTDVISGSLKWNDATDTLSFVKTGGVLQPGSYEATLVSGTDAFEDTSGDVLDGDGNGVVGDDFIGSFVVSSSNERVIGLPDFARGSGQPVNATLEVNDDVTIGPNGTLSGTGTVQAGDQVRIEGTLAPGSSIGALTVQDNVTMESSSTMAVELSGSGALVAGVNNDLLAAGDLTLAGNPALELEWLPGEAGNGLFGGIYTIATYSGSLAGTFADPTLAAEYNGADASVYIDTTYGTNGVDYGSGTNDAITVKLMDLLVGDANLDVDVDVWDFDGSGDAQVLSENTGTTTGAVWGDGDFNFDGDVDVWDFDGSGDASC